MSPAQDSVQRVSPEPPDLEGAAELLLHLAGRTRQLARAPIRAAVWHQVQRGALELAGLAAIVGALTGFFTVAALELGFGLGVTIGVRVLLTLVLGQLAGFVCALLLVAGPGTAATFELGLMRRDGELRTLRLIGIDPRDYLVLPRVVGFALALFVLTFVFQLAAALGGSALVAVFTQLTFGQQLDAMLATLAPGALLVSGIKNILLGGAIGLIVCHQGLVAAFSPAQMPRIARQLLGRSLVALVVLHAAAAVISL
jgi:phospholipid/cholesterol/gamma-HCH transport system permease protein